MFESELRHEVPYNIAYFSKKVLASYVNVVLALWMEDDSQKNWVVTTITNWLLVGMQGNRKCIFVEYYSRFPCTRKILKLHVHFYHRKRNDKPLQVGIYGYVYIIDDRKQVKDSVAVYLEIVIF